MKIYFSIFVLFYILFSKIKLTSIKWEPKRLVKYAESQSKINTHEYFILDPDEYIYTSQKQELLNQMETTFQKEQIKIVFIIIGSMSVQYNSDSGIKLFANTFATEYFNKTNLNEYMIIMFSIRDRKMRISTGKNVRTKYSDNWCKSALSEIKKDLRTENYFNAFNNLLFIVNHPENISKSQVTPIILVIISIALAIGFYIMFSVFKCLKQKKEINKISAFLQSLQSNEKNISCINDICIICLEPFSNQNGKKIIQKINSNLVTDTKNDYSILNCRHKFHTYCLEQWLKKKNECPLCREKASKNEDFGNKEFGSQIMEIQREVHPFLSDYTYDNYQIIPPVRTEEYSNNSYNDHSSGGGWECSGGASDSW